MIDFIREALELLALQPRHLLALLLGLAISWCLTQVSKTMFCYLHGSRATLLAASVAALATFTIAPPAGFSWDWPNFWLAVFSGIFSPIAYKIVIWAARKWSPDLAESLSGDPKHEGS